METLDTQVSPVVRAQEARDAQAERRLVRSVLIWVAVLVPIGAVVFAVLIFWAARLGGAPEGGPVVMGAATGVLAGFFFGVWAGVVASSGDIEHTEDTH